MNRKEIILPVGITGAIGLVVGFCIGFSLVQGRARERALQCETRFEQTTTELKQCVSVRDQTQAQLQSCTVSLDGLRDCGTARDECAHELVATREENSTLKRRASSLESEVAKTRESYRRQMNNLESELHETQARQLAETVNLDSDLKKLAITGSRLHLFRILEATVARKSGALFNEAVFDIKAQNATGRVISRVDYRLAVTSPGRTLPWCEGEFTYEIPGGVELDETVEWHLSAGIFSDWDLKIPFDKRDDLKVEYTVRRLYDARGGLVW